MDIYNSMFAFKITKPIDYLGEFQESIGKKTKQMSTPKVLRRTRKVIPMNKRFRRVNRTLETR